MMKGMSDAGPVQDDLRAIDEEHLRLPLAGREGNHRLPLEPACHIEPHTIRQR
jgi:hypothetical protein